MCGMSVENSLKFIEDRLCKVFDELSTTNKLIGEIDDRVSRVEKNTDSEKAGFKPRDLPSSPHRPTRECNVRENAQRAAHDDNDDDGVHGPVGAVAANATEDIQAAFQAIADSVQSIRLPAELKVRTSRQGINREAQPALNIVTKTAKYAETTVKCLSCLRPGATITGAQLDQLLQIQVAQIHFLQDEFAGLLVQSQFDTNPYVS